MDEFTLTSFFERAEATYRDHRQDVDPWRRGQTYFNVLERIDPEKADAIRATDADPFYDDKRINAFLQKVFPNG